MAKVNEVAAATDEKAQVAAAVDAPSDQVSAETSVTDGVDAGSAPGTVEHPLDIISEIEHLLRIVGNVAVHEFRRISERLADLKNHPAIKPGE